MDATHSKQVHTAKACFDGIFAAYSARDGLLGPRDILEGPRAMGAALVPGELHPEAIDQNLGKDFAVINSSFKWHASCRHTHPSVDALLNLMSKNQVTFDDIDSILVPTYQAAINVLSLSGNGHTIHQSKFSMGFVLAIAAKKGHAMITDFTEADLTDASLRNFQSRVTMEYNAEIDSKFPEQWQGTVIVTCKSGKTFTESTTFAKGDPELPLTRYAFLYPCMMSQICSDIKSRSEIEAKTHALARYGGITDTNKVDSIIQRAWNLEKEADVKGFVF
jgi:2-methylcitrate dehydratase PrpD